MVFGVDGVPPRLHMEDVPTSATNPSGDVRRACTDEGDFYEDVSWTVDVSGRSMRERPFELITATGHDMCLSLPVTVYETGEATVPHGTVVCASDGYRLVRASMEEACVDCEVAVGATSMVGNKLVDHPGTCTRLVDGLVVMIEDINSTELHTAFESFAGRGEVKVADSTIFHSE